MEIRYFLTNNMYQLLNFTKEKTHFLNFPGNKINSYQHVFIIETYESEYPFSKGIFVHIIKSDRHRYVCWSNYKQTRIKKGIGTTFVRQLSFTLQLPNALFRKKHSEGGI